MTIEREAQHVAHLINENFNVDDAINDFINVHRHFFQNQTLHWHRNFLCNDLYATTHAQTHTHTHTHVFTIDTHVDL